MSEIMKSFLVLTILVGVLILVFPIAQTVTAQVCKPNSPCYYEGNACAFDYNNGSSATECIGIYVKKDVNNGKFIAVIQSKYINGGQAIYIYSINKYNCNYYFMYDNKAWYFRM